MLAMYGIIHGGPVVPLTLRQPGGSLVPPLAHDVCQRYIILFFSFPIICDFYVNPYLFSGFSYEDPFYFNGVCVLICTRFNCLYGHLMFLYL